MLSPRMVEVGQVRETHRSVVVFPHRYGDNDVIVIPAETKLLVQSYEDGHWVKINVWGKTTIISAHWLTEHSRVIDD